ncbi:MAG: prepilin-type N-terminal cleavage/methylation domain-containing protein [Rubrivivax sp.]|nr:prepilin-type N-terminal cleavage/methylation domain-containing protein [Rubrivivax sp.]
MNRFSRGLTLIELVVTVAVLVVLGAAAFPDMGEFIDRHRLVSQTHAIAELAQTARSEATKRSAGGASELKSIAMTINPGSPWSIGLANGTAACSGSSCVINQGGTNVPYAVTATQCSGCAMASPASQSVMVFDLRGLVTGAVAETAITLTSPRSKQLSVRISRLGRISVCSPGGSVTGYPSCPT